MFKKWFPALWKMYKQRKCEKELKTIFGGIAEVLGYSEEDIRSIKKHGTLKDGTKVFTRVEED